MSSMAGSSPAGTPVMLSGRGSLPIFSTPLRSRKRRLSGNKGIERLDEDVGAAESELTDAQLGDLRAAADQVQIVGTRYPEENDRMTNLEAPLPAQ
jgi:hypothetical protein